MLRSMTIGDPRLSTASKLVRTDSPLATVPSCLVKTNGFT